MIPSQKDEQVLPENEAGNSNNNNSENKINANCNTCSKKNGVNLTNIAIQCEVTTIDSELTDKNIKSVSGKQTFNFVFLFKRNLLGLINFIGSYT